MSVFKIFRGKRIHPGDPNWKAGRWYVYKRCSGVVVHHALKGAFSEKEALEAEAQIIRRIARKADQKFADKLAIKAAQLPTNGKPKPVNGHIYVLESGGYYKIGQTVNLAGRFKQISKTIIPFDTRILLTAEIEDGAVECERYFHNKYAAFCVKGEWFDLTRTQLEELMREMVEYALIP